MIKMTICEGSGEKRRSGGGAKEEEVASVGLLQKLLLTNIIIFPSFLNFGCKFRRAI
jgi:hypothetical protein